MIISLGREDISKWASRIDTVINNTNQCCVSRVVVIESTPSTMDAATMIACKDCGVLVVASMQTDGRGQHGRHWHDADGCTLPCTFVIDSSGIEPVMLSALIGCAVHETIRVLAPSSSTVMIKWPNDIVIRDQDNAGSMDRKIAGILIEQRGKLTHVGIGINCLQRESDWGIEISQSATSFSQIGSLISRLDLVCSLVEHLSRWLVVQDRSVIQSYYESNDAMIHTHRSFQYDNRRFDGVVEFINPLDCIIVRTQTGSQRLPIAQTKHLGQSSTDFTLRADA